MPGMACWGDLGMDAHFIADVMRKMGSVTVAVIRIVPACLAALAWAGVASMIVIALSWPLGRDELPLTLVAAAVGCLPVAILVGTLMQRGASGFKRMLRGEDADGPKTAASMGTTVRPRQQVNRMWRWAVWSGAILFVAWEAYLMALWRPGGVPLSCWESYTSLADVMVVSSPWNVFTHPVYAILATRQSTESLAYTVADEGTPLVERCAAVKELKTRSSVEVPRPLFTAASHLLFSVPTWNGFWFLSAHPLGNAAGAARSVWNHHVRVADPGVGRELLQVLLDWLPQVGGNPQRSVATAGLLRALRENWIPEAEQPVVTLFMDATTLPDVREAAGLCLLDTLEKTHYQRVVDRILELPRGFREKLWNRAAALYVRILFKNYGGWQRIVTDGNDPNLVCIAFTMLEQEDIPSHQVSDYLDIKVDRNSPPFREATLGFDQARRKYLLEWWDQHQADYRERGGIPCHP